MRFTMRLLSFIFAVLSLAVTPIAAEQPEITADTENITFHATQMHFHLADGTHASLASILSDIAAAHTDVASLQGDVAGLKADTRIESVENTFNDFVSNDFDPVHDSLTKLLECKKQKKEWDQDSDTCVQPDVVIPELMNTKCEGPADHGKARFDSDSKQLLVCRARSGDNPAWVASSSQNDAPQDLVFAKDATTGDFVAIDFLPELSELSIAFWMQATLTPSSSEPCVISIATPDDSNALLFHLNTLQLLFGDDRIDLSTVFDPNDGLWHHWVVAWSATAKRVTIWKDNAVLHSTQGSNVRSDPFPEGSVLVFGNDQDALLGGFNTDQSFEGRLHNINVYDRMLNEAEVAANFGGEAEDGNVASWQRVRLSSLGNAITLEPSTLNLDEDFDAYVFPSGTNSYLKHTIPQDLDDFTISLWMQSYGAAGKQTESNFVFSYAVADNRQNELTLGTHPYPQLLLLEATYAVERQPSLHDGRWHHVAITRVATTGETNLYVDGGRVMQLFVKQGQSVAGKGILVMGQEQDTLGGGFHIDQRFVGKISQFNLFSKFMVQKEIAALMCASAPGDVLKWTDFRSMTSHVGTDYKFMPSSLKLQPKTCLNNFDIHFGHAPDDLTQFVTISAKNFPGRAAMTKGTIMLWHKSQNLGRQQFAFSMSKASHDNGLIIGVDPLTVWYETSLATTINTGDGTWHHIAATFDNSQTRVQLYLDGTLVKSGTNTRFGNALTMDGVIFLGQEQDFEGTDIKLSPSQIYNGYLSQVSLVPRVLSGDEIAKAACNNLQLNQETEGGFVWEDFRPGTFGRNTRVLRSTLTVDNNESC